MDLGMIGKTTFFYIVSVIFNISQNSEETIQLHCI